MGLFRRVRDIFDRDDDDKEKHEEQPQEGGGEQSATEAPAAAEATAVETPVTPEPAVAEPSPTAPSSEPVITATEAAAAVVETTEGTVSGAGLDRMYTTKAGDTLESIAGYFYGAEVQRQRLLDDNPSLNLEQYGGSLPGGIRIRVGEDVARGDTVGGSPSA